MPDVSALQTPFTPSDLTNRSIPHEIRLKYVKDVIFPRLFALLCEHNSSKDMTISHVAEELNVDEWWCRCLINHLAGIGLIARGGGATLNSVYHMFLTRHCNYFVTNNFTDHEGAIAWRNTSKEVIQYLREQKIPFIVYLYCIYFYTEDENKAVYAKLLAGGGDKNSDFNRQKWFSEPFPILSPFNDAGIKVVEGYLNPICEFPYNYD